LGERVHPQDNPWKYKGHIKTGLKGLLNREKGAIKTGEKRAYLNTLGNPLQKGGQGHP